MIHNQRNRTFRDPIHGDILVKPVQSCVIDTTLFQRLRFIRQNGLLHFVFPGAVHTRFSHSLGTMHLASHAFSVLFPEYSSRGSSVSSQVSSSPLAYIATVFETAALLHDLGHTAFSHSMEHVKYNGDTYLHPINTLHNEWKKDLKHQKDIKWWNEGETSSNHEDIGLLMIGVLFGGKYENIADVCHATLSASPNDFAADIRAVLSDNTKLLPSAKFRNAAIEVTNHFKGLSEENRIDGLLDALHTLISGTLDVDRLDYLVRDSTYTGTSYGYCDVEVLINGLCLGVHDGHLVLALRSRATKALDDLLWSRYQLFSQVLNHKTNIMLNALLADAIPQAHESGLVKLVRPKELVDFIEFTDDYVMSNVMSACIRAEQRNKAYDRALVHRKLPQYLGKIDLSGEKEKHQSEIDLKVKEYQQEFTQYEIRNWFSESALVKPGSVPFIVEYDKHKRRDVFSPPGTPGKYQLIEWSNQNRIPAKIESCHFFLGDEK